MTAFAALHVPGSPLLLPNVWEFGVAAFLAAQGFPALGTTSLGVSAAEGEPDGAPSSKDATVRLARRLTALDTLISVDVAEGFSDDPGEVGALAAELAEAGVAGINLEDALGDPVRHAAKITAAKERAPGLFVNARTDTHWLGQSDTEAAIGRGKSYVDAGADGVFVPGLADPADVERLVAAVGVPVNLLLIPGRVTVAGLAGLGVARISLGSLPYRMALAAALRTVEAVRDGGELPLAPPSYDEVASLLPENH
ncbi:isocitrate lyase/PEP mutase family protein [Amycolatopsis regifaucium]|uniref:Phosphonomutase n=1 Tax=Amycolatopsis regifaucium TaxID=546365 RepID=A0A154MGV6_9PSEU|nr:isocitrate lyase/phosphoenolpyruvate mutase family protein [Amycolatopsis regifaucium]KZB83645.1 phosphonomutase [Amycolatopsis regifaucium]OKA03837.1 phosphonomutase [Amycolatopsis regifaucium]SFJ66650.1 2-Methylisocitrate lyase, PEP mutase family [Amycolatopsis regifaucium]